MIRTRNDKGNQFVPALLSSGSEVRMSVRSCVGGKYGSGAQAEPSGGAPGLICSALAACSYFSFPLSILTPTQVQPNSYPLTSGLSALQLT
ncbi:uncharacterized [Tachysurus ichikawai]